MKRISSVLIYILFLSLLSGCRKLDLAELNKGELPLAIHTSSDNIVLNEKERNKEALILSWTTGSNKGTNASIFYSLQIARQGTNFSNVVTEKLGTAVYSHKITTGVINEMALSKFGATAGNPLSLEARIIAETQAETVAPDTSAPIVIKVTPYRPVTATLYLMGDATPGGWDNNNATPLLASPDDPGVFTWTGQLHSGELKFITTLSQWIPSYTRAASSADSLFYRDDFSQPDDKFIIGAMGTYVIKADLIKLTISIAKSTSPTVPPYARLWIVGDATPNGWNIDSPNEMRVDSGNTFVFAYNEILKAGEFKIPTATGNWGTDYYMPLVNHQQLSESGLQLVSGGSPDNKWQITTPGAYKIQLDLYNNKISIQPFTPYTQLWLVGDATPVGWNITNPEPMVQDPNDPYVFTWQGAMTAGEFKIPTATGNWGCDYFMPMLNHQSLSSTQAKFVVAGNPDNKWQITMPGVYKIILNQLKETIIVQKQ